MYHKCGYCDFNRFRYQKFKLINTQNRGIEAKAWSFWSSSIIRSYGTFSNMLTELSFLTFMNGL